MLNATTKSVIIKERHLQLGASKEIQQVSLTFQLCGVLLYGKVIIWGVAALCIINM